MSFCEPVLMCTVVTASVSHAVIKELTCCWNPETSALASLQPTSCHAFWASYFLSSSLSLSSCVLGSEVEGKKENWMINRSATIVWNASPHLLVQRNTLVYSLLSSAVSVSLYCLRIWIKLCWISRCSESLGGPCRPRRTCSKWASFKRNISHSTAQKMPGHRRSQVRLRFEASVPRTAYLKQNHNSHRVFYPPQLLGPRPRLNQFKHAKGRRRDRQIDGVQRLRKSQLTMHCGLPR